MTAAATATWPSRKALAMPGERVQGVERRLEAVVGADAATAASMKLVAGAVVR